MMNFSYDKHELDIFLDEETYDGWSAITIFENDSGTLTLHIGSKYELITEDDGEGGVIRTIRKKVKK